jgi:hypothetical protein
MFALLALIAFVLALFRVAVENVDLVVLGLAFVALHLLVGAWPTGTTWFPWNRPRNP